MSEPRANEAPWRRARLLTAWIALLFVASCSGSNPPDRRVLRESRVVGVSRTHATRLIRLRAGGDTLVVTPEHPFFVASRGWVPAERLKVDDLLDGARSAKVPVTSIQSFETPRTDVFNLLVAHEHSYRVGQSGVLVHNGDCSESSDSESSDDESPHPSRRNVREAGVSPEEKRAVRDWSLKSNSLRALSLELAAHPELRTLGYAEAEARGLLRNIDLGHSGIPGLSREREFEQLRRQLLVDIPSFMAKMPKFRGTVYRGLRSVPLSLIAEWRAKMHEGSAIELGARGGPGYASATDRMTVAQRFARTRMPEDGRAGVVLVIEQRSGVSLRAVSLARSENEVLLPEGARFRVTSVEETSPNNFRVHLVEL